MIKFCLVVGCYFFSDFFGILAEHCIFWRGWFIFRALYVDVIILLNAFH